MRKLIAHRGNNDHQFPENSKEAILKSLEEAYIMGVEFDVRLTKDDQLVLSHDPFISFLSNGHGWIKNMTLKELKQYQFGKHKPFVSIATLEEVLDEIQNTKIILIEIKEKKQPEKIVKLVHNVVSKYPLLNIYICSFHEEIISLFHKHYPQYKVGLVIGVKLNLDHVYHHYDFNLLPLFHLDKINLNKENFLWTINHPDLISNDLNSNVFIITDQAYLFYEQDRL